VPPARIVQCATIPQDLQPAGLHKTKRITCRSVACGRLSRSLPACGAVTRPANSHRALHPCLVEEVLAETRGIDVQIPQPCHALS
jgi:hypothetical protein